MIAYIKGELVETLPGSVILDVHGIGYRIYISGRESEQLTKMGSQVKLHTYFHVKEDAMQLYGFQHKDDLEVFSLLLGVSGIGPKAALGILTAFSADDLRFAVLFRIEDIFFFSKWYQNLNTIAKAPGIGVKTAKKMILELKDKLDLEDAFEKKLLHEQEAEETLPNARGEAVEALTALGYSPADALRAVQKVEPGDDMDTEAILKAALKRMI